MSYIDKDLMDGEHIVYRAKLHYIVFLGPVFWFVIALLFFCGGGEIPVIIGGFLLLFAIIAGIDSLIVYLTSEFGVTNKRVLGKVGFIRRVSLELLLTKVEGIQVNQGILGRILDYGSIIVSGTGGSQNPFHKISAPLELRKKVQEQIEAIAK